MELRCWSLYFPDEDQDSHEVLASVESLLAFFQCELDYQTGQTESMKYKYLTNKSAERHLKAGRLVLSIPEFEKDYNSAIESVEGVEEGFDLGELLEYSLKIALHAIAVAAHQIVYDKVKEKKINVRLTDYPHTTFLKNLKSNHIARTVQVKGNVVRVHQIKPLVTSIDFTCRGCNQTINQRLADGFYSEPTGCSNPKCKRSRFEPDNTTAKTLDWQKIRVQEVMEVDDLDQGRIPRTIDVEVTEDLVDCCIPGDIVTVVGIVKAIKSEISGKDRNRVVYVLYIEANNIVKDLGEEGEETSEINALKQFSRNDLEFIVQCAHEPNLFRLLVHSISPSIYGHDLVKAGLLLTLLGGVRRTIGGQNQNIFIRGDSHMLIVGDPGLGKSQMLRSAAQVAPRGVYVCGNTTTTAGLTITISREGKNGDTAMEAGALVLGDQGVCCIDELDKMQPGTGNALLEAMEQQSISVAKAGLICTLSARTSIIAAANPDKGHYDKGKTVNENLKISPVLLSRFDLTFILIDKPDRERDLKLCRHILNLHKSENRSQFPSTKKQGPRSLGSVQMKDGLQMRLLVGDNETVDPIPAKLLRKYIAYAKKYVHPRLSEEAKEVLQDFYLKLRKEHQSADSTPITTRQLESMIRLSQARARTELREVVTQEDAEDVVELMKESLYDLFTDDQGVVVFSRSTGVSNPKQLAMIKRYLASEAKTRGKRVFSKKELKQLICARCRLPDSDFEKYLQNLNNQNLLLMQGNGKYKLAFS